MKIKQTWDLESEDLSLNPPSVSVWPPSSCKVIIFSKIFFVSGLSIETGMAFKMQQDMKIKTGMSCEIEVKNSDVIFNLALGNFPDECFYQVHRMTSEDSGKEAGSQGSASKQLLI